MSPTTSPTKSQDDDKLFTTPARDQIADSKAHPDDASDPTQSVLHTKPARTTEQLPSTCAHTTRKATPSTDLQSPLPPTQASIQTIDSEPPLSPRSSRLRTQIFTLTATHAQLSSQLKAAQSQLASSDAIATVQSHIRLLHRYNEIKDIGMGLLGLIAEQRGVRLAEVVEEWGVDGKD